MAHDTHAKPRRPGAGRAATTVLLAIALPAALFAGSGFPRGKGVMVVTSHSAAAHANLPIDEAPPKRIDTATFAMG